MVIAANKFVAAYLINPYFPDRGGSHPALINSNVCPIIRGYLYLLSQVFIVQYTIFEKFINRYFYNK